MTVLATATFRGRGWCDLDVGGGHVFWSGIVYCKSWLALVCETIRPLGILVAVDNPMPRGEGLCLPRLTLARKLLDHEVGCFNDVAGLFLYSTRHHRLPSCAEN